MNGLVYVGDSDSSLAIAVRQALAEPPNSPAVERRKQIAQARSIEVIVVSTLRRSAGADQASKKLYQFLADRQIDR